MPVESDKDQRTAGGSTIDPTGVSHSSAQSSTRPSARDKAPTSSQTLEPANNTQLVTSLSLEGAGHIRELQKREEAEGDASAPSVVFDAPEDPLEPQGRLHARQWMQLVQDTQVVLSSDVP